MRETVWFRWHDRLAVLDWARGKLGNEARRVAEQLAADPHSIIAWYEGDERSGVVVIEQWVPPRRAGPAVRVEVETSLIELAKAGIVPSPLASGYDEPEEAASKLAVVAKAVMLAAGVGEGEAERWGRVLAEAAAKDYRGAVEILIRAGVRFRTMSYRYGACSNTVEPADRYAFIGSIPLWKWYSVESGHATFTESQLTLLYTPKFTALVLDMVEESGDFYEREYHRAVSAVPPGTLRMKRIKTRVYNCGPDAETETIEETITV